MASQRTSQRQRSSRGAGARGPPQRKESLLSEVSSHSAPAPSLRGNLMRKNENRDPLLIYEVVEVLGVGSMGSVSKVRKKDFAVGGSSRREFVKSVHGGEACFDIPVFGSMFRACFGGGGQTTTPSNSLRLLKNPDIFSSGKSTNSSSGKSEVSSVGDLTPITSAPSASPSSSRNKDMFYALKTIHLDRITDTVFVEELQNEVQILKGLDHPNIVRAIETYSFRDRMYLLTELCSGGDLYTRDPYTEEQAARITKSILSAVAYLHKHNIAHRDLKYENLMFANNRPDAEIKLIDFGLSAKYGPEKPNLTDAVGTVYTMSPEVLEGKYTYEADVWSVGVLAFMLLSSQMPFYGKTRTKVLKKILDCQYKMTGRRWSHVSHQAKGFVMQLLQRDQQKRPTSAAALKLPWLSSSDKIDGGEVSDEMMDSVQASIEAFAGYPHIKKLALMVVAHKSTSEELGNLLQIFEQYDIRKDGQVTMPEFQQALSEFGYTEDELEEMFQGVDVDGTGIIYYSEFLAATVEAFGPVSEERLAEAFDRLDCDDSGYITAENIREFLGQDIPADFVDDIIHEADLLKDNRISYDEFCQLWSADEEIRRKEIADNLQSRHDSVRSQGSIQRDSEPSEDEIAKSEKTHDRKRVTIADSQEKDDYYSSELQFARQKEKSVRKFEVMQGIADEAALNFGQEKAKSIRKFEQLLQAQ